MTDTQESLRPTAYASRIQRWYVPILLVLVNTGEASTEYIYATLERRFGDLIPVDGYGKLKSGKVRWKNEVSLAAMDLAGRIYTPNLMSKSNGIWTLTEEGAAHIGHTVS